MKAVVYIITDSIGKDGYMTQDEIREINRYGIEIGSHTETHLDLSTESSEKSHKEIFESKSRLEAITGQPVISFCYPSGKYNQSTIDLVKEAGYLFATTTHIARSTFDNLFELKRFRIETGTDISSYLK